MAIRYFWPFLNAKVNSTFERLVLEKSYQNLQYCVKISKIVPIFKVIFVKKLAFNLPFLNF